MSAICDDLRAAILQAAMQGKITDSKIDDNTLRPLWSVTYWDKKFKEVSREKQPRTISYHHVLANFFKDVEDKDGDVFLLSTGSYEGYTTEEKAGEHLCEGEVVTIPWGGKPTIKYYKGKFVTSDNRIATSRDTKILDNRFLYYFMLSRYEYINDSYRGAALKHPEMKLILDMEIPVFPIDEQILIVQKLDELMPRVADLEQSADALASLKKAFPDDIKASLLQAAMQGKLTKQLPEDGSAEDLLEEIKAEKEKLIAEGKIKKQKPLASITDDEIPFSIPENWRWVRLDEIANSMSAGKDKPKDFKKEKDESHPYPVIANGVTNDGILGYTGKPTAPKNTLTVAGRGTIGFSLFREYEYCPIVRLIVIDLSSRVDPRFVQLVMQAFPEESLGTSIPQLTVPMLRPKLVPLPPLAEQKRIIERLDTLIQNINVVGDLIASE